MYKTVIVFSGSDLGLDPRETREMGLDYNCPAVLEGDLMVDGTFHVTNIIRVVDWFDADVKALPYIPSFLEDLDLSPWNKAFFRAMEVAEETAEEHGDIHLTTFTGKIVFDLVALLS